MAAKKLKKIAYFIKRWKNSVLYFGYNKRGILCLYLSCADGQCREVPYSWEYICDYGLAEAWKGVKSYFTRDNSLAYNAKSEMLIEKGLEL